MAKQFDSRVRGIFSSGVSLAKRAFVPRINDREHERAEEESKRKKVRVAPTL